MVFRTSKPGKKFPKVSILEAESSRQRHGTTNFAEKVIFLSFWHTTPFASRFFVSLRPMSPRPALIGSGEIEGKRWPRVHTTSGHGNGPAGKKKLG